MTDTEVHEFDDTPELETHAASTTPTATRRITVMAGLAVAAVLALVAGAVALTSDTSDESTVSTDVGADLDVGVNREEATTATTASTVAVTAVTIGEPAVSPATSVAPAEVTPTTSSGGLRTQIAADPMNRWTLHYDETSRCAELLVDGRSFPKLLCGAPPATATDVIGDIVAVDTPRGRVLVGTADPRVTTFSSYPRQGGAFFHEGTVGTPPSEPSLHLVAGVIAPQWTDVIVRGGAHHLARIVVAPENRAYPRSEVERVLGPPYGEWSGYRKLTSTGYYMGGDQELGFYTSGDGRPCVLYRRFGGTYENVIADGCIGSAAPLSVAALEDISGPYMQRAYIIAAATTGPGQVTLELPDGSRVSNLNPYPDEASGAVAWATLTSHVTIPEGVESVDFVFSNNGKEVGRKTVPVPRP